MSIQWFFNRFSQQALIVTATVGLGACTMADPEDARVIASPTTPIVKNITSFSDALRCMDDLFADYGVSELVLTSDGIPDETGTIALGSKEIMITALSKMSTRSRALLFVDIEQAGGTVFFIQSNWLGNRSVTIPDIYIRGAISQADLNVTADSQSLGIGLPEFSLGVGRDQIVSLVSMDMNIGQVRNNQIIPGMHTTNTITIVRKGQGGDSEGIIGKGSILLEIEQDRSQGSHQSVRNLIELSLIEVLGKYTKVPYWRCLELDSTDPLALAQSKDWFDTFSESELVALSQQALINSGDFRGNVTGFITPAFVDALNIYKAREDLIPNGRIDFDFYLSLINRNLATDPDNVEFAQEDNQIVEVTSASATSNTDGAGKHALDPLGLVVEPQSGSAVGVGSDLTVRVSTEVNADVYCYYEYSTGEKLSVVRVFPNQFQPSARLAATSGVLIPPSEGQFAITPDYSGTERIACVAVSQPYAPQSIPASASGEAFRELTLPLQRVLQLHLDADRFNSSMQVLSIAVLPAQIN